MGQTSWVLSLSSLLFSHAVYLLHHVFCVVCFPNLCSVFMLFLPPFLSCMHTFLSLHGLAACCILLWWSVAPCSQIQKGKFYYSLLTTSPLPKQISQLSCWTSIDCNTDNNLPAVVDSLKCAKKDDCIRAIITYLSFIDLYIAEKMYTGKF